MLNLQTDSEKCSSRCPRCDGPVACSHDLPVALQLPVLTLPSPPVFPDLVRRASGPTMIAVNLGRERAR